MRIISVIGLGYVGLPVAVAFGKKRKTYGFDINHERVEELKRGIDRTGEVSPEDFKGTQLHFTDQAGDLKNANFHIIAVPTPIDSANQPDLGALFGASKTVGSFLKKGDIVVYESTVYPGATEEDCVPVLEKASGLKCGIDFHVGYSPERINPGDKDRTFTKIRKVVSGQDEATCRAVAEVYGSVVEAGVYSAQSIQVAEAAKVIENTQRDLNIALMNELAVLFDRMGISTLDVLKAAETKWNFLPFRPGLVGGHCIGVDPYYLTHRAEKLGYIPQVILAGRRINDSMGKFIAQKAIKKLIQAKVPVHQARITVLGLTFKENVPDLRNSKVADIIKELQEFGVELQIHDPMADVAEAKHEYDVTLTPWEKLKPAHALIVAVSHRQYKELTPVQIKAMLEKDGILIDVKGMFDRVQTAAAGIPTWQL